MSKFALILIGALALVSCGQVQAELKNEFGMDPRSRPHVVAAVHLGYAQTEVQQTLDEVLNDVAVNGGTLEVLLITSSSSGSLQEVSFSEAAGGGDFASEAPEKDEREELSTALAEVASLELEVAIQEVAQKEGADLLGALIRAVDRVAAYDDDRPKAVHLIVGGGAHRTNDLDLFDELDSADWEEQILRVDGLPEEGLEITISGVGVFVDAEDGAAGHVVEQVDAFWHAVCDQVEKDSTNTCDVRS